MINWQCDIKVWAYRSFCLNGENGDWYDFWNISRESIPSVYSITMTKTEGNKLWVGAGNMLWGTSKPIAEVSI